MENEGTTFYVELPLYDETLQPEVSNLGNVEL